MKTKKKKKDKICYNCKFQLSDKCPNKELRSHNSSCEEFKLAWLLRLSVLWQKFRNIKLK